MCINFKKYYLVKLRAFKPIKGYYILRELSYLCEYTKASAFQFVICNFSVNLSTYVTTAIFTHYWAENKLKNRFNVSLNFVNQVPLYGF